VNRKIHNVLASVFTLLGGAILLASSESVALAQSIEATDFENGSLSGWNIDSQTGSLGGTISGGGTGVTLISSAVTFNAPAHGAVGLPTLGDGSDNPYYQPAVEPATWSFSPYGTYAVALQPRGQSTFNDAATQLGLTSSQVTALKALLSSQASASNYGSGNPTDAAWITKSVTLSAGTTYTMSWNYIGTDYVPFNDGSITSLVSTTETTGSNIVVNNQTGNYALLGFTNPGTGDYSTGTYGSTGWQVSTYEVSITGEYLLGFAVFNLDDTALSPVLLVDSQPGGTTKNGEDFGAVAPNNPEAPTVAPTTTEPPATEAPTTTSPVDPCAEPAIEPTEDTTPEEPTTSADAPVETTPPTEAPDESTTTTEAPEEPETTPEAPEEPTTTTTEPADEECEPESSEPPTTDAPTTTEAPPVVEPAPTTTEARRPRPRPSTTTVAPETTTTTTVVEEESGATTTLPDDVVIPPVDEPELPSGQLPVTGKDSDAAPVALLLILSGLLLFCLSRMRSDSNV
jgi:hypothetical protein